MDMSFSRTFSESSTMKILYLFRSLAVYGGIERVLVEKMNALVRMYGMEVYMLTTDQGNHPIPYHLEDNVNIEDLILSLRNVSVKFNQISSFVQLPIILIPW